MNATCTTAEMLSALRDDDGMEPWIVGLSDCYSMEDQATALAEAIDVAYDGRPDRATFRYLFSDGSAIVMCSSGDCWDIGYSSCHCWREDRLDRCPKHPPYSSKTPHMEQACTTAEMLSALRDGDGMIHYVIGSTTYLSIEDQATDLCEHIDVLICESTDCWDVGYADCYCGRDSINPLCAGDHS